MNAGRIHYLDWLKVLIVYGILLFHVSLVFATNGWLVSNSDRSLALSAFAGFCFPWGIPAMFLIAGAGAYFGLRSNTARQFIWKRVLRLLLPMALGFILISPYQRFVASQNPPPPWSELPAYYMSFFQSISFTPDPEWISRYWLHLWFLGYLFAISVLCMPLLLWLRHENGIDGVKQLVRIANRRGGVLLLAAPLFVAQLILRPLFPSYQSWADIATYTFVFAAGAIFFSTPGFEAAIRRDIRWILAAGIASTLGIAVVLAGIQYNLFAISEGLPEQVAYSFFWTFDIWAWNLVVLYVGIRWLNSTNRFLDYAQESVLPFYVIHHPVVLTIASFVVTWQLGVWPKFATLAVLSYVITVGLYELGVRRWAITRTLFGLGPRERRSQNRRAATPLRSSGPHASYRRAGWPS